MKAGIVIAVHALAILKELRGGTPMPGIRLLATADEELGSADSRPVIEAEAAGCRGVLVFEGAGANGALKTARKGTSSYTLQVTGRAAHAGLEPEKGINSALDVSRLALEAAALACPNRGTTVTPTMLTSGSARNTVPEYAELTLDIRVTEVAEQERVDHALRQLAAAASPHGSRIELVGGPNRPPMPATSSRDLFAVAQEMNRQLGLPELRQVAVGGGSDGNLTAALGVSTLDGLGAVGGGAHARDEHVNVNQLPDRVALTSALIARILNDASKADPSSDGAQHA